MIVEQTLSKVALTFTSVPWCQNGFYTWSYAQEEEVLRREIPLTPLQRNGLALFLRHYFAAAALCGMGESCRRVGDKLLSLNASPSMEKCWAQALVGINYVQDTLKNFAHASFFGEGTPADRKEQVLYIAPYEAWALQQGYNYFTEDILPWFLRQDGYPFCEPKELIQQLPPLESLLAEWQWLSEPFSGYLRIVYTPSEQIFS